jgi:hypothetical protein
VVSFATSRGGLIQTGGVYSLTVSNVGLMYIVGCRRQSGAGSDGRNAGPCTVHVVVTGNVGGTASKDVTFKVRMLGDISNDNATDVTDKTALNGKVRNQFNAALSPPHYDNELFDLNGDGQADVTDKTILNGCVRGATIN